MQLAQLGVGLLDGFEAPFLAVDDHDEADHLETGLCEALDGPQRRPAAGDDILDQDDLGALREAVGGLHELLESVALGCLADVEGWQFALFEPVIRHGAHQGTTPQFDTGDRLYAGHLQDPVHEHTAEQPMPLAAEGHRANVDVEVTLLAAGESEGAFAEPVLLEQVEQASLMVRHAASNS